MKSFNVDGLSVPVLVVNLDGRFIAASGMCPHEDVELIDGERNGEIITCPGHAYEFNLTNGSCSHDSDLRLPIYEVSIEEDGIFVKLFDQTASYPVLDDIGDR